MTTFDLTEFLTLRQRSDWQGWILYLDLANDNKRGKNVRSL